MKKKTSERLLILDLDLDHKFLVFDVLDLNTFKEILEEVDDYVDIEHKDNRNVTLKWFSKDAVYYYQINDAGNIVLKDLIAR